MKRKVLSMVLVFALVISMLAPINTIKAEAAKDEWNIERYGDTIDIGPNLRKLSKDPEFIKEADKKVKENASKINFNEDVSTDTEEENDNFTFDGGTKYFLNGELAFKEFTLRSVGENIEIWVANDLSFPEGDPRPAHVVTQEQVDKMRDTFDSVVYPIDTGFFGDPDSHTGENSQLSALGYVPENYYTSEDGTERAIMLVDNIIDEQYEDPEYPFYVVGFYWGTLEMYIDRNIITIDTKNWEERLENTYYPTTAHEFQHLIHDDNDGLEEKWINEGMSDYAEYLCFGEHAWGHINFFLDHPENSLVEWDDHYTAETGPETLADYGQAYLMQLYLNEQFGKEFVRALAKDESHGIESVNKILDEFDTGIDFAELFRRFSIAVAIDSDKPGDGIYEFDSIDININYESAELFEKDGVPAWGANYKVIDNTDKIRSIIFDGSDFLDTPWKVVDDPLGTGEKVFWGNEGHERTNQIILKADLSSVESATLKFDNYIDIEEHWDYGMVQVSTDNGQTWTSLENINTTYEIVEEGYPAIIDNLPGFTGYYEEWVKEEFDLNPYVGQEILINFNYMTDWGYNDSGWFIDNIEIPEIGYSNDCSSTDDFISIDKVNEKYVEYAVTFINEKTLGKGSKAPHYKVVNVKPFNITEEDALQLRQLFKDGNNYMIIWFAAPEGTKGEVDFTYEIINKNENKKDKKDKK